MTKDNKNISVISLKAGFPKKTDAVKVETMEKFVASIVAFESAHQRQQFEGSDTQVSDLSKLSGFGALVIAEKKHPKEQDIIAPVTGIDRAVKD